MMAHDEAKMRSRWTQCRPRSGHKTQGKRQEQLLMCIASVLAISWRFWASSWPTLSPSRPHFGSGGGLIGLLNRCVKRPLLTRRTFGLCFSLVGVCLGSGGRSGEAWWALVGFMGPSQGYLWGHLVFWPPPKPPRGSKIALPKAQKTALSDRVVFWHPPSPPTRGSKIAIPKAPFKKVKACLKIGFKTGKESLKQGLQLRIPIL